MRKRDVPLLRLVYSDDEIDEIKMGIAKVLKSGFLTMADRVREFELLFARLCKTRYSLATNSGTSSLEIALRAIGVSGGSVVIPSNTYMATPLAAIKAGAKVGFTECQRENLQMDPEDLSRKIGNDTKAVIVVHIGGIISPHIDRIIQICAESGVPLIEDAAHAHGAEFDGRIAGQFGLSASFSFYPTKILTTAEGGMMVTDDKSIYEKGIILREHGKADHSFNVHTEIGDNWRFSELHAVLGIQQMKKVEYILAERRRLATLYDALLNDLDRLEQVRVPDTVKSSYYKYIAFLPENIDRSEIKKKLRNNFGVHLTGEVYAVPCHSQPVFKKYPEKLANNKDDSFPATDYVCKHHICLPLYPGLKDEEVEYVVECLKKVL